MDKRAESLAQQGWKIEPVEKTAYTNDNGVYQDGTLAFHRDVKGELWLLAGHTNLGDVTLWRGRSVNEMEKVCVISFNFALGQAGEAFDSSNYPDGPRSRGQIWPYGLWIDPQDGTFHCFIHNETGWGAGDTSYNAFKQTEGEPDFRHIGLMISKDQGRSWDFQGWVLTSHERCWTTSYQPDGMTGGQEMDTVCLGAGDFSFYINEADGYFYIYYSQIFTNFSKDSDVIDQDFIYAARAPISGKGLPGTWRKYHEGSFSEPGNMGRETAVVEGGNVPCVSYNTYLEHFIMTSYNRVNWYAGIGACQLSFSDDLHNWTVPVILDQQPDLSKPYFTICNTNQTGNHNTTNQTFTLLMESNGTDVYLTQVTINSGL